MLFDSLAFAGFFVVFLLLYYLVRGSLAARNALIVAGSFVFYGFWSVRFLMLLIATATFDFVAALMISNARPPRKKLWLVASITVNLAVLGFFKYFNFFTESFSQLAATMGWNLSAPAISVLLPIGISFYTFQSMSYVIDVYRGAIAPSRNWIEFVAYISFFPQLVAGPIERAGNLLPQFQTARIITADHLKTGIALIVAGLFKKIVIADNLAPFVKLAYDHPNPGAVLVIAGTVAFAFRIYCDFSGYSDIARGTAKLLGFELMRNFDRPFFAINLVDFWRRWHISLSTWFRDYVYLPLGGNRRGFARTCYNLFVVMLLAGLWHGARLNFVLWGCWHALGLIAFKVWQRVKRPEWRLPIGVSWVVTTTWVLFGWMLFRAESVDAIYRYVTALGQITAPAWFHLYLRNIALLSVPLFAYEWWRRKRPVAWLNSPVPRAILQGALILAILVFAQRDEVRPFIYFQF
jgi:alginate O-acetyltransferase complex protein AlgI